jgi:hypothetical protein
MRIVLAVLSASLAAAAASAQQQPQVTPPVAPQGTAQAAGALGECDRLINYLETAKPPPAGVSAEQAAAWRQSANSGACHEALQRLTEAKPQ